MRNLNGEPMVCESCNEADMWNNETFVDYHEAYGRALCDQCAAEIAEYHANENGEPVSSIPTATGRPDPNDTRNLNTVYGLLVTVRGVWVRIAIAAGDTLRAAQRLAADGGLVSVVSRPYEGEKSGVEAVDYWIDDEGLLKPGAEINECASLLLGQRIAGNVLVMASDSMGATVSLPDEDPHGLAYGVGGLRIASTLTVEEAVEWGEGHWWADDVQRAERAANFAPLPIPPVQIYTF